MRAARHGDYFSVTATRDDVDDFAAQWPCSGLRSRSVWFQFDRHGDLVDTNDQTQHPNADGSALVALCEDCLKYGAKRLGLDLAWRWPT